MPEIWYDPELSKAREGFKFQVRRNRDAQGDEKNEIEKFRLDNIERGWNFSSALADKRSFWTKIVLAI